MGLLFTSKKTTTTSTNKTTNNAYDQRVGASDGGTALGSGARLDISNEFSDNALGAFRELAKLAGGAIDSTNKALDTSATAGQAALAAVSQRVDRQEKGSGTVFTDIFPVAALALVGLGVAVMYWRK